MHTAYFDYLSVIWEDLIVDLFASHTLGEMKPIL